MGKREYRPNPRALQEENGIEVVLEEPKKADDDAPQVEIIDEPVEKVEKKAEKKARQKMANDIIRGVLGSGEAGISDVLEVCLTFLRDEDGKIDEATKAELKKISPSNYTGI